MFSKIVYDISGHIYYAPTIHTFNSNIHYGTWHCSEFDDDAQKLD